MTVCLGVVSRLPAGPGRNPAGGGGQWAKIPEILKSNKIRSAYILMFY